MALIQLSVYAENTTGSLARILQPLYEANIDIKAMSMADTTNFGLLRLIVDQPEKAKGILTDNSVLCSLTEVVGAGMENVPGGLLKPLQALADKGIGVEYLYAFIGRTDYPACVILRPESIADAEKALSEAGVPLLKSV